MGAFGGLAQLARAPALQAGGHRFDSDNLHQIIKTQTFCLSFFVNFLQKKEETKTGFLKFRRDFKKQTKFGFYNLHIKFT